jgi:hypothetical protein
MNKSYLESKMRSTGMAYVCWFILGIHYGYLGKWGLQIAYWLTCGGLGIWAIIDLFLIPGKVDAYNLEIAREIDHLEQSKN